jgi:hypothetical protein
MVYGYCMDGVRLDMLATRKPPASHPQATPKLPSNRLIRWFQSHAGEETAFILGAPGRMRIAALRSSIGVVSSLASGRLAPGGSVEAFVRVNVRLCRNQRTIQWAVVQSEAHALLRGLLLPVSVRMIAFRCRPPAAAVSQARIPGVRGTRRNSCRPESFSSLHRRVFVARTKCSSGEKCDFRRRSFAFTGLFEL